MSNNNELAIVEKVELVPFFTKGENVDEILEKIKKEVGAFVPDVSTAKGRDAIKKMVTKVTRSKTYLEGKGKDLSAEYKAIPKVIDANRKVVREALTELAEEVRKPLTEYEAECERIAIEKMNAQKAKELAEKVESDHEIGLLLNDKFDRDKAEAEKLESERVEQEKIAQKGREERIAKEAAERAVAAEIERQENEKKAEQERQDKLEANKKHVGKIRSEAKDSLIAMGIDEEQAKKIVIAIHKGEIKNVSISY